MEQITKRDGVYYYGAVSCRDVNDAYRLFRRDYHESLGRNAWLRLDNIRRTERIHGFGFVFSPECAPQPMDCKRVQCWMLGLMGVSYCRMFGMWDIPVKTEEEFDRWFDWALSKGSRAILTRELRSKRGRTSKRYLSKSKKPIKSKHYGRKEKHCED